MSLYADYIKEREDFNTYEDSDSFFTYKKVSDALFIRDIYIRPEARSKGKSLELGLLGESIAREMNLNAVLGCVDMDTKGWERSKRILEEFGYRKIYKDGTMIYFNKDLD